MNIRKQALWSIVAASIVLLTPVGRAGAATTPSTWGFAGTITGTMTVNNGTNTGSIPAGTPYTGTLSIDETQSPAPVAYGGGTRTVYTFTNLAFTVGTSTANSGPGVIDVYDNLTTTTGYPSGDSVYVNFTQGVANTTGVAPSGTLAGAAFNWMGLAFLDPSGKAITGGALPTNFGSTGFSTIFSEFNFGTRGTPWGAGNTSQIQGLTSLTKTSTGTTTTPPPTPITFTAALPDGTVGAAYSATLPPASGGSGTFTYSAAGLPPGLSLAGSTVSGTPSVAGSFPLTVTATDSAGAVATATTQVTIAPAPVPAAVCSGTDAIETGYVARNPGFIVVDGGLNLLDHLWTTNLNSTNTTFLGGLVNWYQTGLVLSYTGTADPAGCILDHLTVAPSVQVATTSLPSGTVGVPYATPVAAAWGVGPYSLSVSGLPAGLSFDGTRIVGTPTVAGTSTVTVAATDANGATASAQLPLTIAPAPVPSSYTTKDEGSGRITAIGPGGSYLMVGSKKLVWNSSTRITVNTPTGERSVVDGFVKVGMKVQWKGLRDKATNTVLTSRLEIN